MIIKSPQKRLNTPINVSIQDNGGNTFPLERKDHVKYLGVLIDDKINWKHHISFVCSRVARNSGIFFKLRHYLTPLQLRQIYYNLINPYISYAIVAWGSAYKSNLKKLQVKQNHIARTIFFATLYGKDTASLASELWQELPTDLKNLSSNCFSKQVKQHLLHKQSYS